MATPEINLEVCTGCGDCASFCPTGAVAIVDGKVSIVKPEACNYCTDCEALCPSGAIRCPYDIILITPRSGSKDQ